MDLDDQMIEAVRRQREHVTASLAVDRRGWTRQQWIEDADRLMNDLDGSVMALANGHVTALLAEVKSLRVLVDRDARRQVLDALDRHDAEQQKESI